MSSCCCSSVCLVQDVLLFLPNNRKALCICSHLPFPLFVGSFTQHHRSLSCGNHRLYQILCGTFFSYSSVLLFNDLICLRGRTVSSANRRPPHPSVHQICKYKVFFWVFWDIKRYIGTFLRIFKIFLMRCRYTLQPCLLQLGMKAANTGDHCSRPHFSVVSDIPWGIFNMGLVCGKKQKNDKTLRQFAAVFVLVGWASRLPNQRPLLRWRFSICKRETFRYFQWATEAFSSRVCGNNIFNKASGQFAAVFTTVRQEGCRAVVRRHEPWPSRFGDQTKPDH